jgi:4-amino-4-deoxychorismate lyase
VSVTSATWIDGVSAAVLPLPDRGLDFGDGLFETLLLRHGHPLYRDLHLQRLQLGLQTLIFPDCLAAARDCLDQAASAVVQLGWHWSALRLTISRGEGPRGYAPPQHTRPRIIVTATALERDCAAMPAAAALCLAQVRWGKQPALAGIKHLNRLEQVLAAAESRAAGAEEAIMLAQSGAPVSVSAGNLFALHGRQLRTPPLDDCGIAGTRRSRVLQHWAPALGLDVQVAPLTLQDLQMADEVFYTNSLLGLRPVASIGAHHWAEHPVCEALFQQYLGELP